MTVVLDNISKSFGSVKVLHNLSLEVQDGEFLVLLGASGSGVRVTAAHPGWTRTDLQRTSGVAGLLSPLLGMKPPQGALPTLRAATDPSAKGAEYFGPHGMMQMRGYPVSVAMVDQAMNDDDAARLWQVSEEIVAKALKP